MLSIAINGFGRIGRTFLRCLLHDPATLKKLSVVTINIGPARKDMIAHMVKYDTLMGTYRGSVSLDGDYLVIDDRRIEIIAESDPAKIDWKSRGIVWVVEASGHFTGREGAQKHLDAGAKKVLITAPAKDEDVTIIPGVNASAYDENMHNIVSMGSCTTNALLPTLKILHDTFIVEYGFMTTTHAYTNSQVLLDIEDGDLRRSRAAALNIIPTTTGATKVLGKVMPELNGLVEGVALRVPVAKVSLIDLTFVAKKSVTVDAVNDAFMRASKTTMVGILDVTQEPLVSSDFSGNDHSVVIDGQLTATCGKNMGKVFGWYDNEWGYSMRLKDFLLGRI
jgi:glyceraldehyde 3-phosphate dehydrogenase